MSGKAADAKVVGDEVGGLKSAFADVFNVQYNRVNVSELSGVTAMNGYLGGAGTIRLSLTPYDVYNSVYLYAEKDFHIYIDPSDMAGQTYTSICVIENGGAMYEENGNYYVNGTINTGVRYRNIDDNMPTAQNPLLIKQGSFVIFTIYINNGNWMFYVDTESNYTMTDKVNLGDAALSSNQLSSVKTYIDSFKKKNYFKYVNVSGEGSSSERIEVYIPNPTGSGYIQYNFVHTVMPATNANVWRVDRAYLVDDSFTLQFALTDQGEWETALLLVNSPDFSGGFAHGDEIMIDIDFFIGGEIVDYTSFTTLTEFKESKIVQTSNMYDPNDHTTVICVHGSEHIFDADGLTLNQSITWSGSAEISTCYMAMFPPKKFGTDKVYTDSDYSIITLPSSNYRQEYVDVNSMTIFNETNGFMGIFSQPVSVHGLNGESFLITDNSNQDYNKCYYVITTRDHVSQGDIWKTKTHFSLSVSN